MHRFYRNTVEHVFFGSGQFSELANLVFETVEISEFAHVEFLPMPIKVNSAERLTHRFSVLAPNFRSCWVYQNYLLYQKVRGERRGNDKIYWDIISKDKARSTSWRERFRSRYALREFHFSRHGLWWTRCGHWAGRSTRSWRERFRYVKNGIHVMHNVNETVHVMAWKTEFT